MKKVIKISFICHLALLSASASGDEKSIKFSDALVLIPEISKQVFKKLLPIHIQRWSTETEALFCGNYGIANRLKIPLKDYITYEIEHEARKVTGDIFLKTYNHFPDTDMWANLSFAAIHNASDAMQTSYRWGLYEGLKKSNLNKLEIEELCLNSIKAANKILLPTSSKNLEPKSSP